MQNSFPLVLQKYNFIYFFRQMYSSFDENAFEQEILAQKKYR